jgi:hypothetical protein
MLLSMETKLAKLQAAIDAGDKPTALRIASKFYDGMSKTEMAIVRRGHECYSNPGFYAMLGFDPEAQKAMAWDILVRTYSRAARAAK